MIEIDLRQYIIDHTGMDSSKVQWGKTAHTIGIPCITLHQQDVDVRYTQDDARVYSDIVNIHVWHHDLSKCYQVSKALVNDLLNFDKSYSANIKDIFVENIRYDDEQDSTRPLYRGMINVTVWHE